MVSPRASLARRSSFVAAQPGGELGCLGGRSDLCFWQPILGAALGRFWNLDGGLCPTATPNVDLCPGP